MLCWPSDLPLSERHSLMIAAARVLVPREADPSKVDGQVYVLGEPPDAHDRTP